MIAIKNITLIALYIDNDLDQIANKMPRLTSFARGVGLGIGIAIAVPIAIATLAPVLKPVVRGGLKTSIRAMERGREMLAEAIEEVEDLVAETEEEMRAEKAPQEVEAAEADDTGTARTETAENLSGVQSIVNE